MIESRLDQDHAWSQREGAAWAASPEPRKPDCSDVVATLERIASVYRAPLIRVENGPEFFTKELDLWAWRADLWAWLHAGCLAELRGLAEGLQ
jgi:hypothetical protein